MEDDLNLFSKWKMNSNFEKNGIFFQGGRLPNFSGKGKTTPNSSKMEDDLNFSQYGRRPKIFLKVKTM